MEDFPVEVIGNILSRVGAARDLVFASLTCRNWQEAWRNHLHILAFNSNDWHVYDELTESRLEEIITRTILQTNALQCLSIILKDNVKFTMAPVISWLMHTSDTLRQLHYNVKTPHLDILEICSRQRLELLDLSYNTISRFPSYLKFPCLRSLSITRVKISTLNLSCWLSACPKVEVLNLVDLDVGRNSPEMSMILSSNSLKDIRLETFELREIILEANILEKLHLIDCDIRTFELGGKGTLRILVLDEVIISRLDVGKNTENLEIVNVHYFTTSRSYFCRMIVKLSKARRMSLWGVMFEDGNNEFVLSKTTSACFPQLTHLSLAYELGQAFQCGLLGYGQLENVVEVELSWRSISHLKSHWVLELLQRCPNLRKLVIGGTVSDVNTPEACHIFAKFTSFITMLMREYRRVNIQFQFL
ncbi:F-box/LRR-repeat protein At1g67190-like [Solanum dulcamara]|uniref:F-box/LRR-repeat protein At1g67190-like n=1 Tax=Solanum dulcamara TaxID=45834 RepID=UPI0024856298|nr:F-box/LRR-repeat protein At1g67190-like [Solanum dulcamara]XP_055808200.1 F-box/LRR-repeat protein At1g67190-like [Solanum dulcamara]XP_055808201.1 F-box/LRR-repeat protein At1g67190-like [Solanum dulcamara]XP_055808202.1 F-box/LRR-repeat protein At1g67190-like [Solanum dulcamara]